MRPALVACILAFGLLLAPLAAAEKGRADAARAEKGAHVEKAEAKADGKANKTLLDSIKARFASLRAAWHENASAIRETCHATEPASMGHHNDTQKEAHKSWAHCIRDGYKAFLEQMRAERKDLLAQKHGA